MLISRIDNLPYFITDHGQGFSTPRDAEPQTFAELLDFRQLKPFGLGRGRRYPMLRLYDGSGGHKDRYVHVLVLEAFRGPRPPGCIALHRNDDPLDNRIGNLFWGTRPQNYIDSLFNRHPEWVTRQSDPSCQFAESLLEALETRFPDMPEDECLGIWQQLLNRVGWPTSATIDELVASVQTDLGS